MGKEKYFTIDSDKLIDSLIIGDYIELLGVGNRYDDKFVGMHNELFNTDNSYNWELMSEDQGDGNDETWFYSLSNHFEIRENDNILILSKHIGNDIRGGYDDDIIYVKPQGEGFPFWSMVHEMTPKLAVEDKDI